MTLAVFTFSLLGAMALGMPIAFALIVCGVALMHSLDIFDSQIVAQNIINGADSFPLMAGGWRTSRTSRVSIKSTFGRFRAPAASGRFPWQEA